MNLVEAVRACAIRPRALITATALVVGSLGAALPVPAAAAGATWHVQAGAVNALPPPLSNVSTIVTAFNPANITLHRSDQVVFTGVDVHTVTFNPPALFGFAFGGPLPFNGTTLTAANQDGGAPLNSGGFGVGIEPGRPPTPPTYTLTVDAPPGTYHFTCRFHRQMAGSIKVVPDAQALPTTDAANQIAAQAAISADLRLGSTILARATDEDDSVSAGVGATSTTGFGAVSVLRFAPSTIEIEVGQTLTFVNRDINVPHTVTFGPELAQPTGLPPGFLPYGSTTISDPTQSANSGFLVSQDVVNYLNAGFFFMPPVPPPHTSASFTFTKPGVFHYFCALHDELGMVGTVVVEAD